MQLPALVTRDYSVIVAVEPPTMPLIPSLHYGGQVPLQGIVPSAPTTSSVSPVDIPEYPQIAIHSAVDAAPDAAHYAVIPTIDIPIDPTSHDRTLKQIPPSGDVNAPRVLDSQAKDKDSASAVADPSARNFKKEAYTALSHSWIARKACAWFGLCELALLDERERDVQACDGEQRTERKDNDARADLKDFWKDTQKLPADWNIQEEREIPDYVIEHAPLIHLFSGEQFWPCDMTEHLTHTTPHLNYTPLQATDDHPTLGDLGELNRWGRFVYLQSDDNVEDRPDWLGGQSNIPNPPKDDEDDNESDIQQSELRRRRRSMGKQILGGRSDAPAVLIVVPKDDGIVDAFWFFFYSYNLGNTVFNIRFGNHVGDWEHTVVRFQHGEPKAVFFSEHSFGEAYTWEAISKSGKRPIGFSATGTHAMYGTPGVHPYVLPGGILHDETDRGPLWDPVQNMYSYTYRFQSDTLLSSNLNPAAPVSWFYFAGHWGDKWYPLSDPRQYVFLGQYHYVNGPLGPRFKNLGRRDICQGDGECVLKEVLGDKGEEIKEWTDVGEGEELSEEDERRVWEWWALVLRENLAP